MGASCSLQRRRGKKAVVLPRRVTRVSANGGPAPPAYYLMDPVVKAPAERLTSTGSSNGLMRGRRLSQANDQSNGIALADVKVEDDPRAALPVKTASSALGLFELASVSMAGVDPSRGGSKPNQDDMLADAAFLDESSGFFAVMDGHGLNGHHCSRFLVNALPKQLKEKLRAAPSRLASAIRSLANAKERSELEKMLKAVWLSVNKALLATDIDTSLSGSTCCAALLLGRKLVTINVGDSRCVAAYAEQRNGKTVLVARALTTDHKPELSPERARIIARGGRVAPWAHAGLDDMFRVWLKDEETPGIAMSRSFGDEIASSIGIIAEPEVQFFEVTDNLAFILIASDGVWEFMSDQEVVDSIALKREVHGLSFHEAVDTVVVESNAKWMDSEGVADDITILAFTFSDASV